MAGSDSMHGAQAGVVRVEKSDVHFGCDSMDTITRAVSLSRVLIDELTG